MWLEQGSVQADGVSIAIRRFSGFWGIPCWETKFSAWLVRVFICPQVGRSQGWCRWGQRFLEIFRATMAHIGISSSWGSCFISILNAGVPPWVESFGEEATWVCWLHLGKYKHISFPVRLVSQISIVYWTVLIPNGQRKRGVLQFLEMYFCSCQDISCGKLKTNKAVLTIKNLKQIKLY